MKTNTNTNIYQQITDKMIAQLEKGFIPWQKPWNNVASEACKAISHETGKPYSMLNQMLLDFRAGEWLTWKQIHAEGGRVKNGEKAFNNSVAYIQSWLRALKNDTKMLVLAATKAEAAVKYILNGK